MKMKATTVLVAQKKYKKAMATANKLKAKANKLYDLWVLGGFN